MNGVRLSGGPGTGALEDSGRVDFARLRSDRRARLFAAMASAGVDAVLLGKEANVRFASGARRLWTAGTRPFAPSAVAVRDGEAVHLLTTWDDGVPAEIGHDHLFGLSWNPVTLIGRVAAIPGMAEARVVGVDGMTPLMATLLAGALPLAKLVDAGPMMAICRRGKSPEEMACIEVAVAVAVAGLAAALDLFAVDHSATTAVLAGRAWGRMCELGVTTPAELPSFELMGGDGPMAGIVGALYAGYEGTVGRTVAAPPSDADRCDALLRAVVGGCRPGTPPSELGDRYAAGGGQPTRWPIAYGLGLGMEPPVVTVGGPSATDLQVGDVLAVTARYGQCVARDVVVINESGPRVLTAPQ
jgi:hypothetical protein